MKFVSPLKIMASKFKSFILNLNQYRNAHFRMLNSCKINYKDVMSEQINKSPNFDKVICIYKVYAGTNRKFDLGNVCSVHEKFFEDAFVELGKLPDDNVDYIPLVIYMGCGIDKDNPRVEVEVVNFCKESIDYIMELLYNKIKEETKCVD